MAYPRRGGATPNTIKLTFDFRTFDKLQAIAKARNQPSDRCAYELLQQVLEIMDTPATAPSGPAPEDRTAELIQRFSGPKPTGQI